MVVLQQQFTPISVHELPHLPPPVRLTLPQRDGRGGQSGAWVTSPSGDIDSHEQSPPSTRPNDDGQDGAGSSPRRQGGGRGCRRIPLILGEVELIQQGVDGGRLKPRAVAPPVAAEKRAQDPEQVAGGEDVLGPQYEVKGPAIENRQGLGPFVASEGR